MKRQRRDESGMRWRRTWRGRACLRRAFNRACKRYRASGELRTSPSGFKRMMWRWLMGEDKRSRTLEAEGFVGFWGRGLPPSRASE